MLYLCGNFQPMLVHQRGGRASKQFVDQTIATLSKPFPKGSCNMLQDVTKRVYILDASKDFFNLVIR